MSAPSSSNKSSIVVRASSVGEPLGRTARLGSLFESTEVARLVADAGVGLELLHRLGWSEATEHVECSVAIVGFEQHSGQ